MRGCLSGDSPQYKPNREIGKTDGDRQTPHRTNYIEANRCCLNRPIVESKEECNCKEKPMKVGMISSQRHQYSKNSVDCHLPWAMTTKGSTPKRSRWVVSPIRKLWPERVGRLAVDQISLHLSKNQHQRMGSKPPVSVSMKTNDCPRGPSS